MSYWAHELSTYPPGTAYQRFPATVCIGGACATTLSRASDSGKPFGPATVAPFDD